MLFKYIIELTDKGYKIQFSKSDNIKGILIRVEKDGIAFEYCLSDCETKISEGMNEKAKDILKFIVEKIEEKKKDEVRSNDNE